MRIEVIYGEHDISTNMVCPKCKGTGVVKIADPQATWSHLEQTFGTCPECKGSGVMTWHGAHTFECAEPVGVGDIVLVPGNVANPDPQLATVTKLGSSYIDPVQTVMGVVERKGKS